MEQGARQPTLGNTVGLRRCHCPCSEPLGILTFTFSFISDPHAVKGLAEAKEAVRGGVNPEEDDLAGS